jgi:hypothetical protein
MTQQFQPLMGQLIPVGLEIAITHRYTLSVT